MAALIGYVLENDSTILKRDKVSDCVSLVRAIVSQQISTIVARVIFRRLLDILGEQDITAESLINISEQSLRDIGLSKQKISYIKGIAAAAYDGSLNFEYIHSLSDEDAITELQKLKGIGEWTAQMFVLFQMGREDIFPVKDGGIRSAMKRLYSLEEIDDDQMIDLAENWRPYRSLACKYLWGALNLGYFKT
jgi:DNA-3-methyladenine glycosylase II